MRYGYRGGLAARLSALLGMLTTTFGPAAAPLLAQGWGAPKPAPFQAPSTPLLAPRVTVAWALDAQPGAMPPIRGGEGMISPSGMLEVGPYGSVRVVGLTPAQAEAAVERHLAQYVRGPRVRLTVKGYAVPVARAQGTDERLVPVAGQDEPAGGPGEINAPPPTTSPPRATIGAPTLLPPQPVAEASPLPPGPPPSPEPPQVAPAAPAEAPADAAVTPAPAEVKNEWHPVQPVERILGVTMLSPGTVTTTSPGTTSNWHAAVRVGAPLPGNVTRTGAYEPMPAGAAPPKKEEGPGTDPAAETIKSPPRALPGGAAPVPVDGPVPGDGPCLAGGPFHTPDVPRECAYQALPPYIVEPPDILLIQVTPTLKDQPIQGQHLVRPDGTINLGIYGAIKVAGMTLEQVKMAVYNYLISTRIKPEALKPENINVDVLAYNSKFYYVITDGGGYGEQVVRFPITGKETVLDAISQIQGLPPVASKCRVWVARTACAPYGSGKDQVLPVDWIGVTQCARHATNYQLMPGDRVYVDSQKIIRVDSALAKIISPIERVLGVTLLASTTVNSFKNGGNNNGR